jgi:hypothetical protein
LKMSIHLGSFGASKFEPGCGLKNTRNWRQNYKNLTKILTAAAIAIKIWRRTNKTEWCCCIFRRLRLGSQKQNTKVFRNKSKTRGLELKLRSIWTSRTGVNDESLINSEVMIVSVFYLLKKSWQKKMVQIGSVKLQNLTLKSHYPKVERT